MTDTPNLHDMEQAAARKAFLGLKCGDVADAVFPSNFDRTQRNKLALALVELTRALTSFNRSDRHD